MSAPWSSMWVAHEWRSTWGVRRSPRPDRVAVLAHHAPGPLAAEPAAPLVQEHRLGVAPPGPLLGAIGARSRPVRARRRGRRGRSGRAGRCAPWPPCRRPAAGPTSRSTSPSDRPTSSEIRSAGAVEDLEEGPVPAGHGVVADDRVEQRPRPRPRSGPWAAPRHPWRSRRRPPGRRGRGPPRPGTGAASRHRDQGPLHRRRGQALGPEVRRRRRSTSASPARRRGSRPGPGARPSSRRRSRR